MKIRTGFVSNSSSSSFIVNSNEPSEFVQKEYLQINDENVKNRIKELADFDIDDTKQIWLSPFYRDGVVKYNDGKAIYAEGNDLEESHENINYNPINWKILDQEKEIAISRSKEEIVDYVMNHYPTIDEFHQWIEMAQKYINNKLNQQETKQFIALDDKVNKIFQYLIDKYDSMEVSYNDIDYLTGSKVFLYILAPMLDDIIVKLRKEINRDVFTNEYEY